MQLDTGAFAALTDQLTNLATRVEGLEQRALRLGTWKEMFQAEEAELAAGGTPVKRARRPSYLRPVDGSQP